MSDVDINASVTVSAYDIIEGLNWNMSRLLDFVMAIDEEAADTEFTIELRDKLTKVIEEEQK